MSFAEQLKSVRLRSTNQPKKKVETSLLCPDSETYQKMMEETQFERYYHAIEPWTFPSMILPVDEEQIAALRQAHLAFQKSSLTDDDAKTEECFRLFPALLKLSEAIDACHIPRPIFVRLSTRSPKDAVLLLDRQRFRSIFQKILQGLPTDGSSRELCSGEPFYFLGSRF